MYQDVEDVGGFAADDSDVIDEAVAGEGYVANCVVDECFRTFPGGYHADPESFDRFYYVPPVEGYAGPAPILVDIIRADGEAMRAQEREEKHVEFKRAWCAGHDRRYVVLVEETDLETGSVQAILNCIAEQNPDMVNYIGRANGPDAKAEPVESPEAKKAPARKRSSAVQRPRG